MFSFLHFVFRTPNLVFTSVRSRSVHTTFTLIHALLRFFTLIFMGGGVVSAIHVIRGGFSAVSVLSVFSCSVETHGGITKNTRQTRAGHTEKTHETHRKITETHENTRIFFYPIKSQKYESASAASAKKTLPDQPLGTTSPQRRMNKEIHNC
jgi:hypothetical protein